MVCVSLVSQTDTEIRTELFYLFLVNGVKIVTEIIFKMKMSLVPTIWNFLPGSLQSSDAATSFSKTLENDIS